jgi:hypothetical protein
VLFQQPVRSDLVRAKIHPAVLMMESGENQPRGDATALLNGQTTRRIFVQRQMRSVFVLVANVGTKNSTQVGVTEDDNVIGAFPADRANQLSAGPFCQGNRGAAG